jgi:hypothetical protein
MKKKLEAELVSIAHRILKMKNKSDLVQLHQETQKLYEKLSVLRFVEENFSDVKPTIGHAEIEEHLAVIFDNEVPIEIQAQEPAAEASEPIELSVGDNENKEEAISDIISGINEKAKSGENEVSEETLEVKLEDEQEAAFAEQQEEVEPVSELDSPEEEVAPVEAEETGEEPTPEEEPDPSVSEQAEQKVEEPAEEEKPKEHVAEEIKEEPKAQEDLFKPAFEWGFDAKAEQKTEEPKITPAQISFDDLLGQDYVDPVFVKPEEVDTPMPAEASSDDDRHAAELAESNKRLADLREAANKPFSERQNVIPISRNFGDTSNVISINKENLNDRISKGITIGLNDRIAFMKHLFNNSSEDYNRVLSQLITFDTLAEAKDFIDDMVKPDYNNWEGKDEYEQRFMEIIEKKFS